MIYRVPLAPLGKKLIFEYAGIFFAALDDVQAVSLIKSLFQEKNILNEYKAIFFFFCSFFPTWKILRRGRRAGKTNYHLCSTRSSAPRGDVVVVVPNFHFYTPRIRASSCIFSDEFFYLCRYFYAQMREDITISGGYSAVKS